MEQNDNCDKEMMVMTVVKIKDVVTQKFKKITSVRIIEQYQSIVNRRRLSATLRNPCDKDLFLHFLRLEW